MGALWNNTKTALLMGLGYMLMGPQAVLPALLIGGGVNIIAFFFSDKIALATMRARKIGPQDDPALWQMAEHLNSASRQIPLRVPEAQANMFIVAPLTGRDMAKLFMTHPPMDERIRRLRNRQEITWTFGCPIAPHLWPLLNRQILTVAHYTSGLAQSARPNLRHT